MSQQDIGKLLGETGATKKEDATKTKKAAAKEVKSADSKKISTSTKMFEEPSLAETIKPAATSPK